MRETAEEWLQKNWRTLVLTPEQARGRLTDLDRMPGGSGVYAIVDPTDLFPIYVGSSVNVNARCRQHAESGAFRYRGLFIAVPWTWRLDLEGEYIFAMKPRLNERSPGGLPQVPIREALACWSRVPRPGDSPIG
jgi:hypothetical protein